MDEHMGSASTSRRDFMKGAVATSVAGTVAGGILSLGAKPAWAQEKKTIKSGLIGCGGRGVGAIGNHVEAGKYMGVEVQVVGLCDAFGERAGRPSRQYKVAQDQVYLGFEGYKKLLESDVEVILLATPPAFRPAHLEAAIKAGKHVFMEKPVAVDPPGCRKVMEMGELAREKGLSIVAGTQRRHSRGYRETKKALEEGAFGKIRGGSIYWCGGALWRAERKPEWNDAEYMIRNWVSFAQMSGDHIVEQHVHNIDIMNWYMGGPPVSALGFGMRARRKTGNQYDFFSVDYEYPEGVHIHSMCRQINGTDGGVNGGVDEHLVGEKGVVRGGKPQDRQVFPEGCPEYPHDKEKDYVQEHIDLLFGILKKQPINEAHSVATSTAIAIMGRTSAYTGKRVQWKHMMDPDPKVHKEELYNLTLTPNALDFEKGSVKAPEDEVVPLPGKPA